jgi:hypothetical protein
MRSIPTWLLAGLVLLVGCAGSPPPVTEAEGTVLLDGNPLPFAQVEFLPELSRFGAEMNSTATTDEKGHYRLICGYKQQPGAVVGKHRVLIREAPTPAEYRGMSGEKQEAAARYAAGLKNRPIPGQYSTAATTTLTVDVTAAKKTYDFDLKR